jgi:PA14 domain/Glycosyl hydrolases family 2
MSFSRICRFAPVLLGLICCSLALAERVEMDLSGKGWQLWQDGQARWQDDELLLPPADLSKLPTNPPTGGWEKLGNAGKEVSVPGTAEEYLGNGSGPAGDVKGVTWWYRTITIPPATEARKILLRVESARLRTEVYIDHQLAGYDVIGNTPFEVDLTRFARPGQKCQLALRVTDPGGNFEWYDFASFKWGKYTIPLSHGFGGITGRVKLISADEVYVDDLYIQNTPAIRDINVISRVRNTSDRPAQRDLNVTVRGKDNAILVQKRVARVDLKPGENTIATPISAPEARLWDLDNPNLYTCSVELSDASGVRDSDSKRFGFRWFAPEGIGQDAVFRLNGKRIVVRTAISWGFWPINGIYVTPEMAQKQIQSAKALGLNMLNFHRCIGSPVVFEKADELGLLYFEEPGAYVAGGTDPFAQKLARAKLLRMVQRDRSHPSLVIYNMINEQWTDFGADKDDALFEIHKTDLRDAHAIDPSRTMVYASAWAYESNKEQRVKLHMRPFDDKQYFVGWQDIHRAVGPETWHQSDYRDPKAFYLHTDNTREIVYNGEEGAISAPPRLAKIKEQLAHEPNLGWDGGVYLRWYNAFEQFLDRKQLREAFPTVDDLCCAMGEVSLEHQGRKVENNRICNANDGYAVNGWEAELIENHSGIVDCFRNPKADPAIMAYYNQPLYVAVKARKQVLAIPDELLVDLYAVNEKNLTGPHTLRVIAKTSAGKQVFAADLPVTLSGGETYGQLLAEAVRVPVASDPGMLRLEGSLLSPAGQAVATGHDQVLVVDWKSDVISGQGAIYERGSRVRDFLKSTKGLDVPAYRDNLGKLDWVVIAHPMRDDPEVIPADALRDLTGQAKGLTATFFRGKEFKQQLHQRLDAKVDLNLPPGAPPDAAVPQTENYCIRWEGTLLPPTTGNYTLAVGSDDGVRLWLDDKLVIDQWLIRQYAEANVVLPLEAGKPVKVKLEFFQAAGSSQCRLAWVPPQADQADVEQLIGRAQRDGSTLLFLDRADTWMDLIQKHSKVQSRGRFDLGVNWVGGQFFVRKHPLFEGLPTNCALNWPYQRLVLSGPNRYALRLEGEQLVAGAYQSWPFDLGTAVAVIPSGQGRLIVSSLAICDSLNDPGSSAHVGRKLLCNYLRYAARPSKP